MQGFDRCDRFNVFLAVEQFFYKDDFHEKLSNTQHLRGFSIVFFSRKRHFSKKDLSSIKTTWHIFMYIKNINKCLMD